MCLEPLQANIIRIASWIHWLIKYMNKESTVKFLNMACTSYSHFYSKYSWHVTATSHVHVVAMLWYFTVLFLCIYFYHSALVQFLCNVHSCMHVNVLLGAVIDMDCYTHLYSTVHRCCPCCKFHTLTVESYSTPWKVVEMTLDICMQVHVQLNILCL